MSATTLSRCTLLVLVLLWCDVSAGPGLDTKFLMELASHFDTSVLTQSCRKVFSKCKARIIPLVLQLESLLQKAPGLLDVECVQKELAKGFPRFDIECVMSDDYREDPAYRKAEYTRFRARQLHCVSIASKYGSLAIAVRLPCAHILCGSCALDAVARLSARATAANHDGLCPEEGAPFLKSELEVVTFPVEILWSQTVLCVNAGFGCTFHAKLRHLPGHLRNGCHVSHRASPHLRELGCSGV
ncbi:hypothetical protein HPB51_017208 [Rhipicephalus microplus]|uniref:Secreted protein n=1 Tax=Rhipicephalus microplus TaxID=6941 RepID=A0A9J6EAW1_RHIMP|nr:hypothetical protein HPB51_017208 [Rhipicephalus microplus]